MQACIIDAVFNEKNMIGGMVNDNTKCNALVHIVPQVQLLPNVQLRKKRCRMELTRPDMTGGLRCKSLFILAVTVVHLVQ